VADGRRDEVGGGYRITSMPDTLVDMVIGIGGLTTAEKAGDGAGGGSTISFAQNGW
jgi:hypothetical protein